MICCAHHLFYSSVGRLLHRCSSLDTNGGSSFPLRPSTGPMLDLVWAVGNMFQAHTKDVKARGHVSHFLSQLKQGKIGSVKYKSRRRKDKHRTKKRKDHKNEHKENSMDHKKRKEQTEEHP